MAGANRVPWMDKPSPKPEWLDRPAPSTGRVLLAAQQLPLLDEDLERDPRLG